MSNEQLSIAQMREQITHIETAEQYEQARQWFLELQDDETPEAIALKEDLNAYMDDYNNAN